MRAEFDAELATLESELQEAGTITVQAIHGALVALQDWEPGVLDYLAGLDDRVDGLYRQIERDVETLIARQAPVATDLRIVLGVLQTNAHVERMSHNCVRIGRLAAPIDGEQAPADIVARLEPALLRGADMTRAALDAFALRDVAAARALPDMDELVDNETGAPGARNARARAGGVVDAIDLPGPLRRADRRPRGQDRRAGRVRRDGRAGRLHHVAGGKRNLI